MVPDWTDISLESLEHKHVTSALKITPREWPQERRIFVWSEAKSSAFRCRDVSNVPMLNFILKKNAKFAEIMSQMRGNAPKWAEFFKDSAQKLFIITCAQNFTQFLNNFKDFWSFYNWLLNFLQFNFVLHW